MMDQIAKRLVELRKESGLSQEQLAERLYVSRQAVGKWERAEGLPDVENLLLLSRLYGVSMDSLLNPGCDDEVDEAKLEENKRAKKKRVWREIFKITAAAVLGIAVGFFAFGNLIKINDVPTEPDLYDGWEQAEVTVQNNETSYTITIVEGKDGEEITLYLITEWTEAVSVEMQDGEVCYVSYVITYTEYDGETTQIIMIGDSIAVEE